ncbi:MAG: hypothetical protein GY861_04355 [bacterium]|nr:hypothetical protein [bacterium]
MKQSEEIKDLISALIKAQGEFKTLKRDAVNPFYKSKYATLDNVIESTSDALRKNGLIVVQSTDGPNIVTQLSHVSGQWIRGTYPLTPEKDNPQGMGSAFTYARRYTYSAIVQQAPSDEDDDGNSTKPKGKKQEKSNMPKCPKCGKELFKDKASGGFFCWKNVDKNRNGCGATFDKNFMAGDKKTEDWIKRLNEFISTLPNHVQEHIKPLSDKEKAEFFNSHNKDVDKITAAVEKEQEEKADEITFVEGLPL